MRVVVCAVLLALLLVPLFYFGALWVAHDFSPSFLQIDRCLDDGGQWLDGRCHN